jgi:peptidoglycan hydrolase-like protein with peptidoglycan-binding domain
VNRSERSARATAASLFALMAAAAVAAIVVLRPFADEPAIGQQLTAPVSRRVVVQTVHLRGSVSPVARVTVPAAEALAGAGDRRITQLNVARGQRVPAGAVVLAVARRPVFVLQGAASAHRDLRPGDTGTDVGQLQTALARLGHYRGGDPPGTFGPQTKRGVERLYATAGYPTPTTGGADGAADRQVGDARAAVAAAERVVADAQRLVDTDPASSVAAEALRNAQRALEDSRALQEAVVARTGPMLPAAEVVYVPTVPARVLSLTGKVGDPVTAPPVTLAYGTTTVLARVTPQLAAPVEVGQAVAIVSDTTPAQAQGRVASIGKPVTDPATGVTTVIVAVAPTRPLADSWAGQSVLLDVVAGRTDAPVLAVPLGALFTTADGRTAVSKVDANGDPAPVVVELGVSGNGYAAVRSADDTLGEGDHVLLAP